MDASPWSLAKLLVPRVPLLLKVWILNILSLSPASPLQDAKTEVVVNLIRSLVQRHGPMLKSQQGSLKGPEIKGKMWIANAVMAAPPEDLGEQFGEGVVDVRMALKLAIEMLGDGTETYVMPEIRDVEGEWTGYRSGVGSHEPRLKISEREQYERLMGDPHRTADSVILYLHGGAYVYEPLSLSQQSPSNFDVTD